MADDIVTKTKTYTDKVRNAMYGKEVRSSIADSIDGIAQNVKDEIARDTVLNDLKTGVNGKVYDTAGDAVRGQINSVKEDLNKLEESVENKETDIYICPCVLSYIEPKFGHLTDGGLVIDNNNKNVCFKYKAFASKGSTISVDNGYKYQISLFNVENDTFIKRVTWLYSDTVYTLESDAYIIAEISNETENVLEDFSIYEHLKCKLIQKKDTIPFVACGSISIAEEVGNSIDIVPEESDGWRYAIVNCREGDAFILNAMGGNNSKLYCFLDENNVILEMSPSDLAGKLVENYNIIAPANTSKLIINDFNSHGHFCYVKNRIESNRDRIERLEKNGIINNLYEMFGTSLCVGKTLNLIKPVGYNCWPFIGTVGDNLVCLYSKGSNHYDAGFNVYSIVSTNGVIWSEPTLIFGSPNIRENITGKGQNSEGDLLIWLRKTQSDEKTIFELHKTTDGVSYSKVSEISINNDSFAHIGDIIWQPYSKSLTAFYNTYGDTREWGVLRSSDDGVTWTQTPIETGISVSECPLEISGTYLNSGKMIAIGRNDSGENAKLFQLESTNYGATWEKYTTNIDDTYQSTPSLCNVKDELTLFYYHRCTGKLRMRKNKYTDVWDTHEWSESKVVALGSKSPLDAGNVNATVWNEYLVASFYSGNEENTGIYNYINNN